MQFTDLMTKMLISLIKSRFLHHTFVHFGAILHSLSAQIPVHKFKCSKIILPIIINLFLIQLMRDK